MDNLIIIAVLAVIIGAAAWYVYKEKKRGVQCIGCPHSGTCPSRSGASGCGGCSGGCQEEKK